MYRGVKDSVFSNTMSLVSLELVGYIFIDNDVVSKNEEKCDTMAVFRVPCLKQIWVYRYGKYLPFLFTYIGGIGIPFHSKRL